MIRHSSCSGVKDWSLVSHLLSMVCAAQSREDTIKPVCRHAMHQAFQGNLALFGEPEEGLSRIIVKAGFCSEL